MQLSPYAQTAETLINNGYSCIPLMPGSKLPGEYFKNGGWFGHRGWQRFCHRLPTKYETPIWNRWPDAGVCVACGFDDLIAIDIDSDDSEILAAILSVLPEPTVQKRGAKGRTIFYRGNVQNVDPDTGEITGKIPSRPFSIGKERVIDLLASGKQTVLPPSIHPTSGKPYQWLSVDTLVDTPLENLPKLPDNIVELLTEALRPYGHVPEETTNRPAHSGTFDDTPWRELKDRAFGNLDAWVPKLGLTQTHRKGRGWRAVADWRGVEDANLSFHPDGITDWGTSERHSPIDVIMLAHSSDFSTAVSWLAEQLGYSFKMDGINYAKLAENALRRKTEYVCPALREEVSPPDNAPSMPAGPVRAPRARIDPFDPANAGGLIEAVAQFTTETAHRASREFSVLAGIGLMSALCNRRYVTPSGFGTNIYFMGLAPPSYGKEHPQNVIKTLLYDGKMPFLLGPGEVSSSAAIEKVARRIPNCLMIWDEIGIILQSVNSKIPSPHTESIRKALLDIYSKSRHGSLWTGKETADPNKAIEFIHSPTLSLLGFSTVTEFYKGLPETALTDGFVARLLVVEGQERGERKRSNALLVPVPELLDRISNHVEQFPIKGNTGEIKFRIATDKPSFYPVPIDRSGEQALSEIEDWMDGTVREDPGQYGIIGRAAENTQKLATLRAVSSSPIDPVVTADDIEWGYAIVQKSLDYLDVGIRRHMAGSEHERLCKAILEALRSTKTGSMGMATLIRRRGISKFDERARKSAINDLVIGDYIYPPENATGGQRLKIRAEKEDV